VRQLLSHQERRRAQKPGEAAAAVQISESSRTMSAAVVPSASRRTRLVTGSSLSKRPGVPHRGQGHAGGDRRALSARRSPLGHRVTVAPQAVWWNLPVNGGAADRHQISSALSAVMASPM